MRHGPCIDSVSFEGFSCSCVSVSLTAAMIQYLMALMAQRTSYRASINVTPLSTCVGYCVGSLRRRMRFGDVQTLPVFHLTNQRRNAGKIFSFC